LLALELLDATAISKIIAIRIKRVGVLMLQLNGAVNTKESNLKIPPINPAIKPNTAPKIPVIAPNNPASKPNTDAPMAMGIQKKKRQKNTMTRIERVFMRFGVFLIDAYKINSIIVHRSFWPSLKEKRPDNAGLCSIVNMYGVRF
jgi:hypothetical protein